MTTIARLTGAANGLPDLTLQITAFSVSIMTDHLSVECEAVGAVAADVLARPDGDLVLVMDGDDWVSAASPVVSEGVKSISLRATDAAFANPSPKTVAGDFPVVYKTAAGYLGARSGWRRIPLSTDVLPGDTISVGGESIVVASLTAYLVGDLKLMEILGV